MPRFLAPRSSTAHRAAVLCLYKALLTRCSTAPLPDEPRNALRNAIRQKFRKNKRLQSQYQLGIVFRAGYEALDHLETPDPTFLARLVVSLPKGLTKPPPVRSLPPSPPPSPAPKPAMLDVRPYPQMLSGPRHVPVLVSAGEIPYLRTTKPEPVAVSGMIRQLLASREKRFGEKVLFMNYWLPIARAEDEWDDIMYREFGIVDQDWDKSGNRGTWGHALERAEKENLEAANRSRAKAKAVTVRMQRIVEEETKLAVREGVTVVRGRKGRPGSRVIARPVKKTLSTS
ncbi:hypothetical protein P154DRAFT_544016 [Amniculicola lignicola CBS 123094]|uniref:Complex 1 LYR protein domain-containing protein n=1 Tax=Amniculicola lignicola CBS 123094 TaxID=1392246 RepID=A0A6A5X0H0_9PLEO|nr:hypothetical protein P154DRAFT_544016 [Amniculicola lignicola CBS 123094]